MFRLSDRAFMQGWLKKQLIFKYIDTAADLDASQWDEPRAHYVVHLHNMIYFYIYYLYHGRLNHSKLI